MKKDQIVERSMTFTGIVTRWARTIAAVLAGVTLLGAALAASPASAQNPAPAAQRRPGRQIRIGEFKIEGQIQKPQAFYILQRSNLNFEGLELKNSFVPKIINSVDQAPF